MWAFAKIIFEYACEKNLLVVLALIVLILIVCYCIRIFERSQDQNNVKFNWLGDKISAVDRKVDGLTGKVDEHSTEIINLKTTTKTITDRLEQKWEKERNAG